MKLAFITILLFAFNTFAASNSDCIPKRSSQTGEIESYDCSGKLVDPKDMVILGKAKSAKLVKSNEGQVKSHDAQIKFCLMQVYQKQEIFKAKNGNYASSFNEINLIGDANCRDLKFGFSKSGKDGYEIIASNDSEAWSVDNLKKMTKIK